MVVSILTLPQLIHLLNDVKAPCGVPIKIINIQSTISQNPVFLDPTRRMRPLLDILLRCRVTVGSDFLVFSDSSRIVINLFNEIAEMMTLSASFILSFILSFRTN